jgi:hypothetical protein
VMLGIMPFLLLEGGLRLFDVGRPGDSSDPLFGFNRNFPLFERHGTVYRTAQRLLQRLEHINGKSLAATGAFLLEI